MILPVIISIILILIISSIQAVAALKTTHYLNNHEDNTVKSFIYQENIIKEGVDSFCRKNFTYCNTPDAGSQKYIYISDILPYMYGYKDLNFASDDYVSIIIDRDYQTINIYHNIPFNNRIKYFNHFKNKNTLISCGITTETLPCTSDLTKSQYYMSPELQIMFLNYFLVNYSSSSTQTKLNEVNKQKQDLTNYISVRPQSSFNKKIYSSGYPSVYLNF